jgi:m7GpppX diphosphatase
MAHPSAPQTLEDLNAFEFQKVLNEDPLSHSLTILGSLGGAQAIVRIEKAALDAASAPSFFRKDGNLIQRAELVQSTDIVRRLMRFALADLNLVRSILGSLDGSGRTGQGT